MICPCRLIILCLYYYFLSSDVNYEAIVNIVLPEACFSRFLRGFSQRSLPVLPSGL